MDLSEAAFDRHGAMREKLPALAVELGLDPGSLKTFGDYLRVTLDPLRWVNFVSRDFPIIYVS